MLFSEININDRPKSSSENAVKLDISSTADFHATNSLIQFLRFRKLICSNYCKYIQNILDITVLFKNTYTAVDFLCWMEKTAFLHVY